MPDPIDVNELREFQQRILDVFDEFEAVHSADVFKSGFRIDAVDQLDVDAVTSPEDLRGLIESIKQTIATLNDRHSQINSLAAVVMKGMRPSVDLLNGMIFLAEAINDAKRDDNEGEEWKDDDSPQQ